MTHNHTFVFRCDVPKGFDFNDNYNPDAIPGDISALLGVFENIGTTPTIEDYRFTLKGNKENIGILLDWYEIDEYAFNALSLQDRFYFETVDDFLTECEKHNTYRKGLWGDGKPVIR